MRKLRRLKKKLINSVKQSECKKKAEDEPARVVWGKFIKWLRERSFPILHASCGELTEVCIKGEELIVSVSDKSAFNLLELNLDKLNELLSEISNLHLKFELSVTEENKELLAASKKLGDLLRIK